jgi:hypothetical protein
MKKRKAPRVKNHADSLLSRIVKSRTAFNFNPKRAYAARAYKLLLAQAAQMQALPWASSGNFASKSALKSMPTHQQAACFTPMAFSISIAH